MICVLYLPYANRENYTWRTISYNMAAAHANCATFWTSIYERCEELYKEKYGNFPTLVKRDFKQSTAAGATTAAVTKKVWGEYVSVVC